MSFRTLFISFVLSIAALAMGTSAQRPGSTATRTESTKAPVAASADAVRSSAAYAEIVFVRTEVESQLEALLVDYTDEFPRVKELRHRAGLLKRDADRLLSTKPEEAGKLTLALGRLMVRRTELELELWKLRQDYKDEHPEVKRARMRVEIFNRAINEILD